MKDLRQSFRGKCNLTEIMDRLDKGSVLVFWVKAVACDYLGIYSVLFFLINLF